MSDIPVGRSRPARTRRAPVGRFPTVPAPPVPRLPLSLVGALPYLLLFAAALAVGVELARPFTSASIAFDSQASVLYFQRIVSGQPLEQFITTTPKPLLTVVFGVLYQLTHDWRPLGWTTLLVDALAITVSAVLARRVGGPVAATFTGVALVNNGNLLFDVGYGLGSPFALLGWATAGLAITAPRPRYALAGVGLAFATLVRVETLILIGVALVALAWSMIAPLRWRVGTPPRRAWLVPFVGLLALPIMLVHDLALTGDPLYWTGVAARYAAATTRLLPSALQVAEAIVSRYWAMGAASLLAILGVIRLLADRRHALLVGLLGLGPALGAFLILLAARGIDVPIRYTAGIDAAVVFAAGAGIGTLSVRLAPSWPLERLRETLGRSGSGPATVALVAAVAILVTGPYWRQNPGVRTAVRTSLDLAIDADRALPYISAGLASLGDRRPGTVALLGPGPIRPRLAVDLGLPLTQVGGTAAEMIDVSEGYPSPGQIVFHVRAVDAAAPGWAALEIDEPTTIGPVILEPLFADVDRGAWVIAIR